MKPSDPRAVKNQISALIAQFGDDDGLVREKVRLALVGMGNIAVAPLIEALTSKDKEIRWESAKALGEIASNVAVPALIKALEDYDVRWLAAEALIEIGRDSAVPLLEALMARSNEFLLRQGAHHVLYHLSGADSGIAHHLSKHPRNVDPSIQQLLKPVVSALEDAAPRSEAPIAAEVALDALRHVPAKNSG